jgi:hypothetical protein
MLLRLDAERIQYKGCGKPFQMGKAKSSYLMAALKRRGQNR